MLWQRELVLVLGGSVYSTSIILMAYMGGLALGNLVAGKWLSWIKPEQRLYAAIQVATGLFIFIFPAILVGLQKISGFFFSLSHDHQFFYLLLKAVTTFLVLLIPSTLIGSGYPVMVSQLGKLQVSKNISIGKLNFLNSLGSVFGALVTGFLLIRLLGSRLSLLCTGVLFILSGILVSRIPRLEEREKMINREQSRVTLFFPENLELDISINPKRLQALLPVLFFFSGFTALSYELLYNRILIYFLGNTTFSFTLIVTFFILGYSLGSFFFYSLLKKKSRLSLFLNIFILFQILIALYHLFLPMVLPHFHRFLVDIKSSLLQFRWDTLFVEFLLRFAASFLLLIIPAGLFGFIFPLVYRIYFGIMPERIVKKTTGKIFGRLNAINTLGSVTGPFLTGFVLIAWFQVSLTLRIISLVNILVGFTLLFFVFPRDRSRKSPWLKLTFLMGIWMILLILLPVKNQLGIQAAKQSWSDSVLYYREGVFGTVSVSVNRENLKMLKINGVGEVPTDPDSMRAFRMLAYLPFMAHDNPRSLLSIAFGGGITFGSIANTGLPVMKCVEICPDVVGAARLYSRENNRVLENKMVEMVIQDGRNYIQNTREKFDIITSDATHPASFDSWVLYTREFYLACGKKLKRNGVMAQWIPLHGLAVRDYRTILKTFSSVFKNTSLYLANAYTIIIGSEKKIVLKEKNFLRWNRKNKDIEKELRQINIHSVADFQNCLLLDDKSLDRFSSDSPISADRFSQLQFAELRTLRRKNTLLDNLIALLDFRQKQGWQNPLLDPYLKARILVEEGKIPRALAFMQGLKSGGKSPETAELQSRVFKEMAIRGIPSLMKTGNIALTIRTLENYLSLYPEEGYFYSVLGYLYFKQNRMEAATELLRRSIRLSSWNPAVQKIALQFFLATKNYPVALLAVENLLRQEPGNRRNINLKQRLLASVNH